MRQILHLHWMCIVCHVIFTTCHEYVVNLAVVVCEYMYHLTIHVTSHNTLYHH